MDVTSATTTLPQTASNATGTASKISTDFDTFLKMMTTQLKNQDPLNPIDSADYAVQLATFSGVEQQTKTNQLLESLQSQFGMMGMAQMAGWVGREARVASPVWVEGAAVPLSPNPATGADRTVMVVTNAAGDVVNRRDIPVSSDPLNWTPVDMQDAPLPAGKYKFQLESYTGDENIATTDMEVYAPVTEVRGGANGTSIVIEGGIEVPVSLVTALRG